MPNDLTKLAPYVEQARTTLTETTERERALVQALSDEFTRLDGQTLQGIRTMAAEHEARRAGILDELQALSVSIGTFRTAHDQAETVTQRQAPTLSYHDALERKPALTPHRESSTLILSRDRL